MSKIIDMRRWTLETEERQVAAEVERRRGKRRHVLLEVDAADLWLASYLDLKWSKEDELATSFLRGEVKKLPQNMRARLDHGGCRYLEALLADAIRNELAAITVGAHPRVGRGVQGVIVCAEQDFDGDIPF